MIVVTLSDAETVNRGGKPAIRVEVLRTGEWTHEQAPGGVLRIAPEDLDEIVRHFRNGTFGYELPVNLNHMDDSTDAIGWVTALERQGESLYATIRPTSEEVVHRVQDGRLRYASAELVVRGRDPETRREVTALRAVALTNRPYIKRMAPAQVVMLSERARLATQPQQGGKEPMNTQVATRYSPDDIQQLNLRLSELEERQWESDRDLLLSEYEHTVPPSILRLARYIFDALRGRTVTLSEIRESMPGSRIVRLSENASASERVPIEDMVLAILEEVSQIVPNRPRLNLSEQPLRYTLRTGDERTTRDLIARAERLAASENISFSDAIKRVAREL
jgi:hypothetical protein